MEKSNPYYKSVGAFALMAVLIAGVVAMLPLTGNAFAQTGGVTITTSADPHGGRFFGPQLVEIQIFDPVLRDDNTQSTNVLVDVTAFGTQRQVPFDETSTTSGRLLGYIIVDQNNALGTTEGYGTPGAPFSTVYTNIVIAEGIASGNPGPAGGTGYTIGAGGHGAIAGGMPDVAFAFGVGVGSVAEGGQITISYPRATDKVLVYDDTAASVSLDRSTYGPRAGTVAFATYYEPNANLDPTATEVLTETVAGEILIPTPAGTFAAPLPPFALSERSPNGANFRTTFGVAPLGAGIESTSRSVTANDYQAFTGVLPGRTPTVGGAAIADTATTSYTVVNTRGTLSPLSGPITYSTEYTGSVMDQDANTNSETRQTYLPASGTFLTLAEAATPQAVTFSLFEKGTTVDTNSSRFVPNASGAGTISLTWKTGSAGTTFFAPIDTDITASYTDGSWGAVTATQIFRIPDNDITISSPRDSLTRGTITDLVITAPQLNDDSGVRESYNLVFGIGAPAAGVTAIEGGAPVAPLTATTGTARNAIVADAGQGGSGVRALDLEILYNGMTVPLAAIYTLTFTEENNDSDRFIATLNVNTLLTAAGITPADGDRMEFKVRNMFAGNAVPQSSTKGFTMGLTKPTVEIDRNQYPVPRPTTANAALDGIPAPAANGIGGASQNLGPVRMHVTIVDPSANTNDSVQDVLVPASATAFVTGGAGCAPGVIGGAVNAGAGAPAGAFNAPIGAGRAADATFAAGAYGTGTVILTSDGAGPVNQTPGTLLTSAANMVDRLMLRFTTSTAGNPAFAACAAAVQVTTAIVEEGASSGVFRGTVTVWPVADSPATWVGAAVRVDYLGTDGVLTTTDDANAASATFTAQNGSIEMFKQTSASVSAQELQSTTVIRNGDTVLIRVVDPNANRDSTVRERVGVSVQWTTGVAQGAITAGTQLNQRVDLDEVGLNGDTFEKRLVVGVDTIQGLIFNVQPDTQGRLRYNDPTPSGQAGVAAWPALGTAATQNDLSFTTASTTGRLVIRGAADGVISPSTRLQVCVVDPDLELNPNTVEQVPGLLQVSTNRGAASSATATVEQTTSSSMEFCAIVRLAPGGPGSAGGGTDVTVMGLPGDVFGVRYNDQSDDNGARAIVSTDLLIVSQDPLMSVTSTTVQAGAAIEGVITDIDAVNNPDIRNTINLMVTSTSDRVGLTNVLATENEPGSGEFHFRIPTSTTAGSGSLFVRQGDQVTIEYPDAFATDFRDKFLVLGFAPGPKSFFLSLNVGVAASVGSTTGQPPNLTDSSGNPVTEVTTQRTVTINLSYKNNEDTQRTMFLYMEVRASDRTTAFAGYVQATAPPNGNAAGGLAWTPAQPGDYTIRTFSVTSLTNPAALSPIATTNVTVS